MIIDESKYPIGVAACRCGGQAVLKTQPFGLGKLYKYVCQNCGRGVNWNGTDEAAAEDWNYQNRLRRR